MDVDSSEKQGKGGNHERGGGRGDAANHDKWLWLFFHTWKFPRHKNNKHQAKHLPVKIFHSLQNSKTNVLILPCDFYYYNLFLPPASSETTGA